MHALHRGPAAADLAQRKGLELALGPDDARDPRTNEVSASAMGKDVEGRANLQVFVLGSAVIGMAGADDDSRSETASWFAQHLPGPLRFNPS